MDTFNVTYVRAHVAADEFKTLVDGEYTAHEQRMQLWTNPRRSWNLDFQKTPETFAAVRAFFITQKGKYKAFKWNYEGEEITVRFDTDKLEYSVDVNKFKEFSLRLVEVVTNE